MNVIKVGIYKRFILKSILNLFWVKLIKIKEQMPKGEKLRKAAKSCEKLVGKIRLIKIINKEAKLHYRRYH